MKKKIGKKLLKCESNYLALRDRNRITSYEYSNILQLYIN